MADLRSVLTPVLRPCFRKVFPGSSGAKSYDPDALAWYNAVVAAGSTVNANNRTAQNTLIKGLKADGVWSLITELYLYAGPSSLAGGLVKAKGSGTRTNVNFVSGDFSQTTGLLGNGTTKYISNGILSNSLANLDHGLFVNGSGFATTSIPEICAIGVYNGTNPSLLALEVMLGNYRGFRSGNPGAGNPGFNTSIPSSGSIFGCRGGSTDSRAYQDGVLKSTYAVSTTVTLAAIPLFSFAINNSGPAVSFDASRHAVEAITKALTDAQALALHNRVSTYVASLT